MRRIVWYHFTDLHFRSTPEFERAQVLAALWEDIAKQVRDGLLPHFVAVTGDIAFAGKKAEYDVAERDFLIPLVQKTGIDRKRVYFVPGNHDFDREYLEALNGNSVRALQTREQVSAFLEDQRRRDMYLTPFAAYSAFVQRFTGATYFSSSPAYAYRDQFEAFDTTLCVAGMNTAWACNYRIPADGRATDKGSCFSGNTNLHQ